MSTPPRARLSPGKPAHPLPPSSPDYILSLSSHRDLSRRRHESHDLSWCREQLSLLSDNLKVRLHNCKLREEAVLSHEIESAARIEAEVARMSGMAMVRIKAEYEKRLGRFEDVVSRYQGDVNRMGEENEFLKKQLNDNESRWERQEKENTKLKEEVERARKRGLISDWKDMKKKAMDQSHGTKGSTHSPTNVAGSPVPHTPHQASSSSASSHTTPHHHSHHNSHSTPGTPPAVAALHKAKNQLSVTEKQISLLTMGMHSLLHVMSTDSSSSSSSSSSGGSNNHKTDDSSSDLRTLSPQILPSLLYLTTQINTTRATTPHSTLAIKERAIMNVMLPMCHYSKSRGDGVILRAPYVLCNKEHVYDAAAKFAAPASPAAKSNDLGFLTSSCPQVRLNSAVVVLRLLLTSPPTPAVHNISPSQLLKASASILSIEVGSSFPDLISAGVLLPVVYLMLGQSDFNVVQPAVKALLYVIQACNNTASGGKMQASKQTKFDTIRAVTDDGTGMFERTVEAVFGIGVGGNAHKWTKDLRDDVREVVAILLQIVAAGAPLSWRTRFMGSNAGDSVRRILRDRDAAPEAKVTRFTEGNLRSCLEYLSNS
jgi:hypothetical protein